MSASQTDRPETAGLVRQNIRSLLEMRKERERQRTGKQRFADAVALFVGNMHFGYALAVLGAVWVGINVGWLSICPIFDPFPFPLLSSVTSVIALFLSTFILVSQNRMSELEDQRAELNVQISLLAEHEVTQLIHLVESIAIRVGARKESDPQLEELKQNIDPLQVIKEIDKAKGGYGPEAAGTS